MMKLILSFSLIWTLSSTAGALQCWSNPIWGAPVLRSCQPTELCAATAVQGNRNGTLFQFTQKLCVPSSTHKEGTHTYAANIGAGAVFASFHVCSTDGCNSVNISYPDIPEKNSLQCFTCEDETYHPECNLTAQCYGEMDRCISVITEHDKGERYPIFGCVTANYCEVFSPMVTVFSAFGFKFTHPPKCCEDSFCNSAWSVKLNVITLLSRLITLIFY